MADNGLAASVAKPYKSTFGNRLGAYVSGLANVPVDIFKYSGMGANRLMNIAGLRDDKTADQVYSAFASIQNPLDFNDYATKEPAMYTAGNAIGNGVIGGGLAATTTKGLGASLLGGGAVEGALKPALLKADRIYDTAEAQPQIKTQPVRSAMATEPKKGLSAADIRKLAEIESGSTGYNAHNTSSGAYGRYQFIPTTAAAYAKKLGLEGDAWKTPENQDRMFEAFTQDNVRSLEKKGLPVDLFHVYGAHQQGATGFFNILKGNLTPKLESNMRNNLPSDMRNLKGMELRDAWVDYWKGRTEA